MDSDRCCTHGCCGLMQDNAHTNEKPKSRAIRFTEETTLHGIRYVTNGHLHMTRRLIWLILLVLLAVWLAFGIFSGISKYFSYPLSTVVSFDYVNYLEFPAVTICNYNQFRRSQIKDNHAFKEFLRFSAYGENFDWLKIDAFDRNTTFNLTDAAIKWGHQIEDMLLKCKWNKEEVCGPENFTTVISDLGICFTFNGLTNSERMLTVTEAGSSQGLELRLSAEQDENYWGFYGEAGFKLYVHPKGQFPLVDQYGISLSPGFSTAVRTLVITATNQPYPYKSNCGTKELKYSAKYSAESCVYECHTAFITELCKCRFYQFPGPEKLCSLRQILQCVFPSVGNISDLAPPCDCPLPCKEMAYDTTISFTVWPSDFQAKEVAGSLNITEDYLRSNILKVNIFFDILGIQEISQVPSYDYLALQSDIGAYMGLLGGASIITFFELIDCLLEVSSRRRRKADATQVDVDASFPNTSEKVNIDTVEHTETVTEKRSDM